MPLNKRRSTRDGHYKEIVGITGIDTTYTWGCRVHMAIGDRFENSAAAEEDYRKNHLNLPSWEQPIGGTH